MSPLTSLLRAALIGAMLLAVAVTVPTLAPGVVFAQAQPEGKPPEQKPGAQADQAKEQKKIDEFAEATRLLGGPASNPECVWLGRRVVGLMWRDDLDTAFRHLELYDRFGCPSGHVQATFRCVVRQGALDPKQPESLNARVHACWVDPNRQAQVAATQTPPQAQAPSPAKPN